MKTKTLADFMDEIKTKGLRKTNQFQIVITTGHADIDKSLENFTMWANSTEIPERGQEFIDVPYHGYPFKTPGKMTMSQEITMTVKSDGDGEMRRACLKWMSHTSNPAISDGAVGEGDKKISIDSNVRVILFKDDMKTISEIYKLVGASVAKVGAMEFSNENVEIATFELALEYQYWEIEEVKDGKFDNIR